MLQVGAHEAKIRLSKLIDEVAKGEEIIITKHVVPVAALVPVTGPGKWTPKQPLPPSKTSARGANWQDCPCGR